MKPEIAQLRAEAKAKGIGKGKGKDTQPPYSLPNWVYAAAIKKAPLKELGSATFALASCGDTKGLDENPEEGIGRGPPRDQQMIPHQDEDPALSQRRARGRATEATLIRS